MNARWQRLSSHILETLKVYEIVVAKWEECERTQDSFLTWCSEQDTRLALTRRIGNNVSVRHAAKEIKVSISTFKFRS